MTYGTEPQKSLVRLVVLKKTYYKYMLMAAMATARAWLAVKPHRPLIKFRKGGGVAGHEAGGVQAARSGHPQAVSGSRAPSQPRPILEDWQMPRKYQRLAISEEEIEYINTGGPPPK